MTTQTIGSLQTARMLASTVGIHGGDAVEPIRRAPNGFRRLGAGMYRTAYLEKATNTVYKVGDYTSNVSESSNARRLLRKSTRNLGFDLRIPRTRTYRMPRYNYLGKYYPACIIAQEYAANAKPTHCDGEHFDSCTCKRAICFATIFEYVRDFTGLIDMHGENVLVDKNDTFWLIDLAE